MVADTRANPQGPRFLTQRNLEKQILDANGTPVPRPDVAPGYMQLFSYYKPGLTAGNYAITAEQIIDAKDVRSGPSVQNLRICNRKGKAELPKDGKPEPQEFEVMAPQFSLDPKLVNSFYPPEGHQDEGRILPHIVIEDPHFPWERDAGNSFAGSREDPVKSRERDPDVNEKNETVDKDNKVTTDREKMVYRSIVPWVRLLVFDPEELKLASNEEAQSLGIPQYKDLNPKLPPVTTAPNTAIAVTAEPPDITHQPANGAFQMTAGDYLAIDSNYRVKFDEGYAKDPEILTELKTGIRSKEGTQIIFPTKDTFYKLCNDVESNKYLAHVRNINTVGFPNAGVEEDGLYSIVISARTGAFNISQPKTQIVHLVSIEHHDKTLELGYSNWDAQTDKVKGERIGLISLYSWTYTALPPDPVNFVDSMKAIVGDETGSLPGNIQMLRPPTEVIDALKTNKPEATATDTKARAALADRFSKGYTLSRWRCETGEVTAAFTRGPLVPVQTPAVPVKDWPTGSTTSKNYQIFDTATGLMDLSYSSAWQLGKILAISDTSFSSALMRFRSFIQNLSKSKVDSDLNGVTPTETIVKGLISTVSGIGSLVDGDVSQPRRVTAPLNRHAITSLDNPIVAAAMDSTVHTEVGNAAAAGDELYNEFNLYGENNTDWSAILKWITDKLYLGDIPAHILFPDPSFIPEESIRFFYIDDAWMDCLIDGALSVGNHLEKDDDRIKTAVKQWYNMYLKTTIKDTKLKPQIPCYGFILRSQIVKVMPDLKITVNWNNVGKTDDQRAPVCQWLRPDDHTLVCLLDRLPEELHKKVPDVDDAAGIVLSQPLHQQRFSFGYALQPDMKSFEFRLRHLYTNDDARDTEWPQWDPQPQNTVAGQIDIDTRVLRVGLLAKEVNRAIQQHESIDSAHKTDRYIDYVPNSAELALELNDPAYYFALYPEHTSENTAPRQRQLWAAEYKPKDPEPDTGNKPTKPSDGLGDIPKSVPPSGGSGTFPVPVEVITGTSRVIFKDNPNIPKNDGKFDPNQPPQKCFTLEVFPDYKGPQDRPENRTSNGNQPIDTGYSPTDYVPTQNKYLLDLIFAVKKDPRKTLNNTQRLREILINIPHRARPKVPGKDGTPDDLTDALMLQDWDGGVRMLSNQRFVPLISRNKDYLQVRLIPRSAEEHPEIVLNDGKTAEISFRLSDVEVPATVVKNWVAIKGKQQREQLGFVRVDMWERYSVTSGVFNVWNRGTFVIKRDVADDN